MVRRGFDEPDECDRDGEKDEKFGVARQGIETGDGSAWAHLRRRDREIEIDVRVHAEEQVLHDDDATALACGKRNAPGKRGRSTAAMRVERLEIAIGEGDVELREEFAARSKLLITPGPST